MKLVSQVGSFDINNSIRYYLSPTNTQRQKHRNFKNCDENSFLNDLKETNFDFSK